MNKNIYSSDEVRVSENWNRTVAGFSALFQMDKTEHVHYRDMVNMKIHGHLKMRNSHFKHPLQEFYIGLKWSGRILLYFKGILRGIPDSLFFLISQIFHLALYFLSLLGS